MNDELKDSNNDTVGKKIKDEKNYETFFRSIGKADGKMEISFYHNGTAALPVWIEGTSDYNLSSLTADPFEVINLTVPLDNGETPKFRLHVGPDSDVFEFGITVLNLKSFPQVGGYWTVEFNTTGTADLTITPTAASGLPTHHQSRGFFSLFQ